MRNKQLWGAVRRFCNADDVSAQGPDADRPPQRCEVARQYPGVVEHFHDAVLAAVVESAQHRRDGPLCDDFLARSHAGPSSTKIALPRGASMAAMAFQKPGNRVGGTWSQKAKNTVS